MEKLCIAIPTYNRRAHLERRLVEIVPQLSDNVCLHVFDNGSDDGTDEVARQYSGKIRYSRSASNLGMCRNFIRCFEETEGEWLWILSDDDPVQPEAAAKALSLIRQYGNGIINFTSSCGENLSDRSIRSLRDFFAEKDITSIMYISSALYERRAICGSLRILTPASFTMAPHVALILDGLQSETSPLHLSTQTLLVPEENPRRWSGLDAALGLSLFPEFIQDHDLQRQAAQGLRRSTRWMLLWGLMEVTDPSSATRWRRITRQTNLNLRSYGATFLSSFLSSSLEPTLLRREIILQFLRWLPASTMRVCAKKMHQRNRRLTAALLRDL